MADAQARTHTHTHSHTHTLTHTYRHVHAHTLDDVSTRARPYIGSTFDRLSWLQRPPHHPSLQRQTASCCIHPASSLSPSLPTVEQHPLSLARPPHSRAEVPSRSLISGVHTLQCVTTRSKGPNSSSQLTRQLLKSAVGHPCSRALCEFISCPSGAVQSRIDLQGE